MKQPVESLLKLGVAADTQDEEGETPLMKAALGNHLNLVTLLLNNKVNLHAVSNSGKTPLMYAAIGARDELIQYLLDQGASIKINQKDKEGNTPLILAAIHQRELEVFRTLVNAKADVHAMNEKKDTAFIIFSRIGIPPQNSEKYIPYQEVIKLLK